MTAPERIWAYPSYVTGWDSANAHSRYILNSDEYILASHVADMIRQAVEAEREACAACASDRADNLEDAAKWGGGAKYLASINGGRIELRNLAAAIRARKGE